MFYIKRNLSAWARLLRLCLSIMLVLAASYFLTTGLLQILLFITAGCFAATAFVGCGPACALFERKTLNK